MIEHGLWVWLLLLLVTGIAVLRRGIGGVAVAWGRWVTQFRAELSGDPDADRRWLPSLIVVVTAVAHMGYYTLVIGGDHFEWRVYSHLLPLALISFVVFLSSLNWSRRAAIVAVVVLIVFSWPIPWAHYRATAKIKHLRLADTVKVPVADKLPGFLGWLTEPQDRLQGWLIDHHVCVRRKEHELFWLTQVRAYPDRTMQVHPYGGEYPVAYFTTVGVPGWILPRIAIIDGYGLSDYVIARHAPYPREERLMAHDRYPPEGYVQSFLPNVRVKRGGQVEFRQRPSHLELTAERIVALERYWEDKIVHGIDTAASGSGTKGP
jgi:arabinofuranosyltransferase